MLLNKKINNLSRQTAPKLKQITVSVTYSQSNISQHRKTNSKCYAATLVSFWCEKAW